MGEKYKAQAAYAQRNGLVTKSYKLKQSIADDFKAACDKDGRSQASVLQELMVGYIDRERD